MCNKERIIRTDNSSVLCRSCSAKVRWANKEYYQKCVDSHIGNKPSEETKRKLSAANKGRSKDIWGLAIALAIEAHKQAEGEASLKWIFQSYKRNAKNRNIPFSLNIEEFRRITSQLCFYCGTPPSNQIKDHIKRLNGVYTFNGIDRIDNSQGYVINNVVPCCKTCNYAKRKMSVEEFLEWCNRVANYTKQTLINILGSRERSSK